jgi:hypothetical protein
LTKQQCRRVCVEVDVLCDLLACAIRSHSDGGADAKKLERQVLDIPARFEPIALRAVTTPAQRRVFERNWRKLAEKGGRDAGSGQR